MRGAPTEFVQASTDVIVLSLPAVNFVRFIQQIPEFANYFYNLSNLQEAYKVAIAAAELQPLKSTNWRNGLVERVRKARTISFAKEKSLRELEKLPSGWNWYLSTPDVPGVPVGTAVLPSAEKLPIRRGFILPYRLIGLPDANTPTSAVSSVDLIPSQSVINEAPTDLQQLGILEEDNLHDEARHPAVRGKGPQREALAVSEMMALSQQIPFRRDAIQKVLENQFRRDKGLTLELIAGLCELLGMSCQLAKTDKSHINSIEAPAVFFLEDVPVVFYGLERGKLIIAHPHHGIRKLPLDEVEIKLEKEFRFIPQTLQRLTSRFGWNWFTPLLKKYNRSDSRICSFIAGPDVWTCDSTSTATNNR